MPLQRLTLDHEEGSVEVRDHPDHLMLLLASMKLTPDGTGFFVVPPGFFSKRSAHNVHANLRRFGVFVNAALSLPSGTFEPATGLPGLLLIVRRTDPGKLFVGELISDAKFTETLLDNLKRRKEGKTAQLGALMEQEGFFSFSTFLARREIERLGRSSGLEPVELSNVAVELNLPDRNRDEGFKEKPNAVYLPIISTSPAVTTLADLQIEPQNYIQMVLDPNKVVSRYVANSFNTPLGRKIRESLSTGFIPKISKARLKDAHIYLPNLDTQAETLRVQATIDSLSTQLQDYQRLLWRQPKVIKDVDKGLRSLNRDDSFESWMESLPFPLASILWTYHAADDPAHKVDHLLNFVEALSEFTCTVLLSGLRRDSAVLATARERWSGSDYDNQEWFKLSTFGGWNRMGERLAKEVRRLLSDKEMRDRSLDLFGNPEPTLLDSLIDKKLFAVLREVKDKRDRWKGHSGIVGSQESTRRLAILESDLSRISQLIADSYTTTRVIGPTTSRFKSGIHYYQAKLLMGTRSIFRNINVQTYVPMEEGKLYLLNADQYKPVELLPFFRLMESPKTQQTACYFYNRLDGEDVRWVSYHFDSEAEIVRPDEELVSALSLLSSGGDLSD